MADQGSPGWVKFATGVPWFTFPRVQMAATGVPGSKCNWLTKVHLVLGQGCKTCPFRPCFLLMTFLYIVLLFGFMFLLLLCCNVCKASLK